MYYAHETSIISSDSTIGEGTKIWHFCHIMGAKIGKNVTIGQNCFIGPNVVIGDGCKIQNNVSLYDGVELEENVFVGPSVVFTNVKTPRAFMEKKHEFRRTRVKHSASLGANATIICGNTISEYALIGAGAVVSCFVPPRCIMLGVPSKPHGLACDCGETVAQHTTDTFVCAICGARYRVSGTIAQWKTPRLERLS